MKAIIFDLDGTIADSTACVVGAAQCVGRAAGLRDVSDEAIRQRIGEPVQPGASHYHRTMPVRDHSLHGRVLRCSPLCPGRRPGDDPFLPDPIGFRPFDLRRRQRRGSGPPGRDLGHV